ncbi:MAG: divalent-cation tolerance protein CutA [Candidatus Saccharicenans sp.]|uniref:divalent-cation tolerance protein CutA n=1 Tax=Candidatus Saccharicenans sp. TaxID=2819258 RepID=UPI0040493C28
MSERPELILVLTTFPGSEQAREAASLLVEKKLAACCTFIEGSSIYLWQGKKCEDKEVVLLIKARAELYPELEKKIKEIHPYEVPEIIALPVILASQAYSDWIKDVTSD